jgi:membrane-associated protease RseP (regulator of RpoE activity)
MLNMDMVGRLEDNPLIVNGTGTAEEWSQILDSFEDHGGIPLARSPDGFGPSDHTSFYARDIPVLHFFTNVHGEYHRPADHWELIDQAGLERVTTLVEGILRIVADQPVPLVHIAGAGTPPEEQTGGYGAYLGTIPDFTPVDFGVLLSGVSGGSPAEEVGLQVGDILIRLGSFEIEDLYVLTEALQILEPGTEVEATFLRDGQEVTVLVTLRERGL